MKRKIFLASVLLSLMLTSACTSNEKKEESTTQTQEVQTDKKQTKELSEKQKLNLSKRLPQYIMKNNIAKVKDAIDKGADVDYIGDENRTALMEAVEQDNIEIVNMLLAKKPNLYVETEEKPVAKYQTVIMMAKSGVVAKALIGAGYDVNKGNVRNINILLNALRAQPLDVVVEIIKGGANISVTDKDGNTALMYAVFNGRYDAALELVNAGANLNYKNGDEIAGGECLVSAVDANKIDLVKALISKGVDVNYVSYGDTALSIAQDKGLTEIIKVLKDAGAKK